MSYHNGGCSLAHTHRTQLNEFLTSSQHFCLFQQLIINPNVKSLSLRFSFSWCFVIDTQNLLNIWCDCLFSSSDCPPIHYLLDFLFHNYYLRSVFVSFNSHFRFKFPQLALDSSNYSLIFPHSNFTLFFGRIMCVRIKAFNTI